MNPADHWYGQTPDDINRLVDSLVSDYQRKGRDITVFRRIFSFIDMTTLESTDNEGKIDHFCQKALSFAKAGFPSPAAICVYPPFVRNARFMLNGTGINIAAVTGYFPSGQASLPLKMAEVKYTLEEGADEIDFVISRGKFLEGDYNYTFEEVASVKELIKAFPLKVILETGELKTPENIRKASEIAIAAGADFIKTSTGKSLPVATEEAAWIMTHVIKEHYLKTGYKIGFKPSGGITESIHALRYYLLAEHVLGIDWMTKGLFRIGASRLVDNILNDFR